MTKKEILEKAIQKAIDGGWDMPAAFKLFNNEDIAFQMDSDGSQYQGWKFYRPAQIIFNHNFAKALWGEEDCRYDVWLKRQYASGGGGPDEDWYDGKAWEFHLQQMVIADDPIKYLGENI